MKVYHDGLERSGNVYFANCLNMTLNADILSLRTHDVKTLIEYKENYPFVISLRDALPSMVSAKIYRDYCDENNLFGASDKAHKETYIILSRYKSYIHFLIQSDKFFIAPFDEFIKNHNAVIKKLVKVYPELQIKQTIYSSEEIIKNGKEYLKFDNAELGNFPRKQASNKTQIEKLFLDNHFEEIQVIQEMINHLYQRYYNL